MKDLIEALTILAKYIPNDRYAPIHCEHDALYVHFVTGEVSAEDAAKLAELGFFAPTNDGDGWYSYRFGSC